MPTIVHRSTPCPTSKPSQPWFGDSRVARIVRLSVEKQIHVRLAGAKLKATVKEMGEALEMREDWDGEVALKVRRAIEISNYSGLGRRYS